MSYFYHSLLSVLCLSLLLIPFPSLSHLSLSTSLACSPPPPLCPSHSFSLLVSLTFSTCSNYNKCVFMPALQNVRRLSRVVRYVHKLHDILYGPPQEHVDSVRYCAGVTEASVTMTLSCNSSVISLTVNWNDQQMLTQQVSGSHSSLDSRQVSGITDLMTRVTMALLVSQTQWPVTYTSQQTSRLIRLRCMPAYVFAYIMYNLPKGVDKSIVCLNCLFFYATINWNSVWYVTSTIPTFSTLLSDS